jgi:hypothetical protein
MPENSEVKKDANGENSELEAEKRKLARPPKDKREVTIGPTTSSGPDVTTR